MAVLRLAAAAEADIIRLLAWSKKHFGNEARRRYEQHLALALRMIGANPEVTGSSARPELGESVRSFHLRHCRARQGGLVKSPRHLLLHRVIDPEVVGVGRVLHDAMEISRHLPTDYGDE